MPEEPPLEVLDVRHTQRKWREDFLSIVPLVAIVLLMVMIALLLWAVNRDDAGHRQTTLQSDAHWVEQALRYQLGAHEDLISRLALDLSGEATVPESLSAEIRAYLAGNTEVLGLAVFRPDGGILAVFGAVPDPGARLPIPAKQLFDELAVARVVYTAPYPATDGDVQVDLAALSADRSLIEATISLPKLIQHQIPWWIAEKYSVELLGEGDQLLAGRSYPGNVKADLAQQIAFDPPIPGGSLRITAYSAAAPLSSTLLYAGIIGTASVALLSLAILQSHSNRRKRAEQRLSSEIAFRHSMEESLTVGIRAKDHTGRCLYVNKALCDLVGYQAEELVGSRPPMPYWPESIREDAMERHNRLGHARPQTYSFDSRFVHKTGRLIDVHVFEAPLIDAGGNHQGWIGSIIDVTELRDAERSATDQAESLQRSSRLISLGEMASTLAHELNQPLAAIASYATGSQNLINAGRADVPTLAPVLEKLAMQVDRAGKIIRRIQDFSRKRPPVFATVSLAETIEATAAFLTGDARDRGAMINLDLVRTLAPVMADRILIEQVLINLMRNAVDSMAETPTENKVVTVSLRRDRDAQVVEVKDRGGGISAELAPLIFDAFTTTRAEGMGIGLNVCRSIIELHRGQLSHRANPGGGTIFRFAIPANLVASGSAPNQKGV